MIVEAYAVMGMAEKVLRILRKGDECVTKDTCVAKHIYGMLQEEEHRDGMRELMLGCDSPKVKLLWEIFFEIDMQNVELLEEHIYRYGSMVKEHDYFGRDLFIIMVALLHHLKRNGEYH